jgi:hypothetical protein
LTQSTCGVRCSELLNSEAMVACNWVGSHRHVLSTTKRIVLAGRDGDSISIKGKQYTFVKIQDEHIGHQGWGILEHVKAGRSLLKCHSCIRAVLPPHSQHPKHPLQLYTAAAMSTIRLFATHCRVQDVMSTCDSFWWVDAQQTTFLLCGGQVPRPCHWHKKAYLQVPITHTRRYAFLRVWSSISRCAIESSLLHVCVCGATGVSRCRRIPVPV